MTATFQYVVAQLLCSYGWLSRCSMTTVFSHRLVSYREPFEAPSARTSHDHVTYIYVILLRGLTASEGFVLIEAYTSISVPVQLLLTMADAICGLCRSFASDDSLVEMLCFWLIFIGRDHVRRSVCLALRKANKRVPPC